MSPVDSDGADDVAPKCEHDQICTDERLVYLLGAQDAIDALHRDRPSTHDGRVRPERREHFQDRGGDAAAAQDAHASLEQGVGPFGQAVPGRRPRVAAVPRNPASESARAISAH